MIIIKLGNMFNKIIFIILLTIIALSCKKTDTSNSENNIHKDMIKTAKIFFPGGEYYLFKYSYNDSNLIKRCDYIKFGEVGSSIYDYNGNIIITKHYNNNNSLFEIDTLFLKNGLLIHQCNNLTPPTHIYFFYDNDGYDTLTVTTVNGDTTITTHSFVVDGNNIPSNDPSRTFYTELINTITFQKYGYPFYGKSDVNPIKSMNNILYTYIYKDGLIVQRNGNGVSVNEYTYY